VLPEQEKKGDSGMWVGGLGNAKEIGETGHRDAGGVSARER
jgi:hypothetical protein